MVSNGVSPRVWPVLLTLALLPACGDDSEASEDTGTNGESSSGTTNDPSSDDTTSVGGSTGIDDGSSGTTSDETTGGELPEPLVWQSDCVTAGYDLLRLHPDLQCTGIDVPLDWSTPDGDTIPVAALRIPAQTDTRVGTLWALDGGPGGSGLGYAIDEALIAEFTGAGWDVIIPPHRGTFSPLLECNVAFDSPQCRMELEAEWGEGLPHFNTLEAARDVGELIRREQLEGEPAVVYGISYGTYWGQFYASEFPTQANAIVLDSTVPTSIDITTQEYTVQSLAEQLLQACVDDAECGAQVGYASGAAFSQAVIDALDNGECGTGDPGAWEDSNHRFLLGQLINQRTARNYVPLLAALLARCDPALSTLANDAMGQLFGVGGGSLRPIEQFPFGRGLASDADPQGNGSPPPFDLMFSGPLQMVTIATSMLWAEADPTQVQLDTPNHFATLGFDSLMGTVAADWNELPKVEFEREFQSQTPMLVLNAHYDLQTPYPWAEIVAEQHGATLVGFSDGSHGVTGSGSGGKSLAGESCARAMMLAFMADPTAPVDTSCAEALPQVDVTLQRPDLAATSMAVFGTDDPWSLLPEL